MNRRKFWKLLSAGLALLFLLCMGWLCSYFVGNHGEEERLNEIKENYVVENVTEENGSTEAKQEQTESDVRNEGATENAVESIAAEQKKEMEMLWEQYQIPQKTIDFEALQQENKDIYAWITVPGTVIDYPVVQHAEEADYYLMRNLDGSKGYPGCIYTQFYNSKDWNDPNTVIYGHNMKNGSMFAGLHQYRDSEFFEENPYIYIYSEDKVRVYQIFGAYEFSDVHLLLGFDTKNPETFGQYLDGLFQLDGMNDNFNHELEVNAESRVISLTTCISNKADRRYIVSAVLTAEADIQE